MKYALPILLCLILAAPCVAGSCQDVQEAAGNAMRQRNGRVSETHDPVMPNPEEEREGISSCLSAVNALGDVFSLGIKLPDMDQIINGLCSQADSYISQKINEAHNQVLNQVNSIGGSNVFKVYGTGGEFVANIKGRLK